MNDHEAQRIAAAMHEARPDWPAASVLTLIRKNLIDKPRRDVFVALAWVASEANSHTPARVLEQGPWWKATAVDGSVTHGPRKFDESDTCSICSFPQAGCQARWAGDHEFLSVSAARAVKAQVDVHRTVAALKADVTPVAPPPPARTFADLEHDRPELAERLTTHQQAHEAAQEALRETRGVA